MAIKVQYGGGAAGSAAGQIIAQSGLANLQRQMQVGMQTQRIEAQAGQADLARQQQAELSMQQIAASRDAQMLSIDARADIQKQSADDAMKRVTLQAGLGQEMQDREFDLEVQKMQEQAKIKARETEWKFSAETKRRIAQNNSERQAISNAFDSGIIDEEQRDNLMVANTEKMAGFQPSAHPADENKPPPPQEQTWTDPSTGALLGIDRSGNPRQIVAPDKTSGFLREQNQLKVRQAASDARNKMLATALSTTVKNMDTGKEEPLGRSEVSAMMSEYDRHVAEYEAQQNPQPAPGGGLSGYVDQRNEAARVEAKRKWDEQHAEPGFGGRQAEPWSAKLEAAGIDVGGLKIPVKVKPWQAKLPPEQGAKLAMFDALDKKYPKYSDIPLDLRPAYAALLEFAEQYYGER